MWIPRLLIPIIINQMRNISKKYSKRISMNVNIIILEGTRKRFFINWWDIHRTQTTKRKKEMKKKRKNNRILSTNQKGNVANHTTVIPEIHLHYHQYTNFSSCHHSRSGVTNTEITQQSYEHSINCKCNRILL